MNSGSKDFEYFAFISYKREDEKWAKWLQKRIESYRLPTALRKGTDLPNKIRPVFRDQSELSGGNLKAEIEKGLNGSKYLIVICSPRAAKSPWVSKEVQHFINQSREEFIIPFIIDGTPNASNPEDECFPEGLCQLTGEKEILGININEMGRDAAAIKVIARMLDLRFDTLWQRYKRQEEKEKTLLKKRHNELFKLQARIVASKCKEHVESGDSYLAVKLVLTFLNKSKKIDKSSNIPAIEEVLRLASQKRNCWYSGHSDIITALAFSPVDNLLVTGSNDHTLKLWNIKNGQEVATLGQTNGLSSSVEAISFDSSGKLMVSSTSRCIRIWCMSTLQVLDYFEDIESDYSARILNVHFYDDSIIYSNNCQICLYDRNQHLRVVMYDVEKMIKYIKIDHQCKCLFCSSKDTLYVFKIIGDKLKLIKEIYNCSHFDMNSYSNHLVTIVNDVTTLWVYGIDEAFPESIRFVKKRDFRRKGLTYLSNDGSNIYCYSDGNLSVFGTEGIDEGSIMSWRVCNGELPNSAIWFNQDRELFYIAESSAVKQIDVRIPSPEYIPIEQSLPTKQKISAFTIDADSEVFATSKEDNSICYNVTSIIDLFNNRGSGMIMRFNMQGHDLQYLRFEEFNPINIELNDRGSYIVVNHSEGLWILDSESLQSIFEMNKDYIKACPGSRNSNCLICVKAADGFAILETNFLKRINVWDEIYPCDLKYATGEVILTLSSSRKLLGIADDKVLYVISIDTHKVLGSLILKSRIRSACFSSDSKKIAVTTDGDNALSVFDLKTSERIAYKPLFKIFISRVHYSKDGKYLLVTGDHNIIVFSTDGYIKVAEMIGEISHKGIKDALFHDDMIVSLDSKGYLRKWHFEPMNVLIDKQNIRYGAFTLSDEVLLENYII